jgi:hypothetical protein
MWLEMSWKTRDFAMAISAESTGLARSSTLVVGSGVGVAARDLCKAKGQEMQCKCQWLVRVFQTRFVERDSCFSRSGANRILEPLAFDEALPLDLHM